MAGFAAATYMRGIKFIQIPTTLLSQVDSSVGGKVGVDFFGNKNMIGAFYQPEFVYINIKTLNTLPYEQIAAGMAEAIKYGYIIDKDFLNYFKDNMEKIKKLSPKEIKQIIYTSCKAKAYVVSEDEKESGLREILNFGHTFGHSIESLSNFELLHGECVAIGIISALKLSLDRGYINQIDLNFAKKLFSFFELPINIKDFDKNKSENKTEIPLGCGRIRKLTPRECWRLQGFSEELFDKAAAVNSDAQLYKQAGNGVTIPVVYAVGKRIVEIQNELNKEAIEI